MADDLIERLRERARNRVPEDNQLGMTPEDFLEGQAADALASKDAALSEIRAELEALKRENKSLSAEIDALEEEGCGVDDDIRKLNARAEAAESELEMARKALEKLEAYCSGGFDDGRPPPNRDDAIGAAREALAARALAEETK